MGGCILYFITFHPFIGKRVPAATLLGEIDVRRKIKKYHISTHLDFLFL